MSWPLINTFPEVGLSRAPIMFNRVDLPLPDGPTIEINSPFFTSKLTSSTATTLDVDPKELEPNILAIFLSSSTL